MAGEEYNKIHVMARARKLVMQKFGSDLLHFWPMADASRFIRDLMRQRPLIGSGVSLQQPGMLDYGIGLQSGYLSDVVKEQGDTDFATPETYSNDYYMAVPVPVGRWKTMDFWNKSVSAITDAIAIAPPSTPPSNVSTNQLLATSSSPSASYSTPTYPLLSYTFDNNDIELYSSRPRVGQRITLNGAVSSVKFKLYKVSSPAGTLYVRIRRVSDDAVLATASTTLDVSTLTGVPTWFEFTFSPVLELANEDVRIVCEWSGGDGSNHVRVRRNESDVISWNMTWYTTSWSDQSGDCVIEVLAKFKKHTVTFPFFLDADSGQWWAYFKKDSPHDTGATEYGIDGNYWNGSAWATCADVLVQFNGVDALSWPSRDKFTIGVLVNLDTSPVNGVLVALANASEGKAWIRVTSAKKAEGYFKNSNGDFYTVTSPAQLHPGFNLITLSYEKGVADGVKLGVNGLVVDRATPSNFGLFNEALALGVGALMKTDKTTSDQLKNAVVDDVFLAKGMVLDADLWDIYQTYITAAPLMTVESAAA